MGLSMSDAISTSFLEAIVMGAFPIQSCTSCANEWVTSGETAFLVPPEDPQVIADALRRALVDDHLVDKAAEMNNKMLRERLDYKKVKDVVISTYQKIYHKESPA
jgi:glycosyltransferase involved in cell wall biosynthesis